MTVVTDIAERRRTARLSDRLLDIAGNLHVVELAVEGAAHSPHNCQVSLEHLTSYICETRRAIEAVAEEVHPTDDPPADGNAASAGAME